jgi:CO/xanthine dehydrogenase FAD-binding subunit
VKVTSPTSLADACRLLASDRALVPIAGATDVLVHWPVRTAEHDKSYLDLLRIKELRHITWADDSLTLGALATYWNTIQDTRVVQEFPLLIDAARQVGAIQIQSRGTWAGNIANGSPAADGVPVLMAYDADVVLASSSGTRRVSLATYYTGYRQSVRRPDELICAIVIPRRRFDFAVFHKVGPRRAQAITKVGLAITRPDPAPGGSAGWRVVASSVAPTVRRCRSVEKLLDTQAQVQSPAGFLAAVSTDVSPIDDIRSTSEYRRTVMCRLLYHSLKGHCPSVT